MQNFNGIVSTDVNEFDSNNTIKLKNIINYPDLNVKNL